MAEDKPVDIPAKAKEPSACKLKICIPNELLWTANFIGLDLSEYKLKVDHFDKVHVLGQENIIDGAPNFRQVS